jgi:hypothetical protein
MLIAAFAAMASPAAAQSTALEGTWLVQVTLLTSCTGGTPLPPFASLLTFTRDGTLTGTTLNPAFAPGQRSSDHGVWSAGPGGTYAAASVAFITFTTAPAPPISPGFLAGAQRIDQIITLLDASTFSSTATVSFFDAAVQRYRTGCATASARRFQ